MNKKEKEKETTVTNVEFFNGKNSFKYEFRRI